MLLRFPLCYHSNESTCMEMRDVQRKRVELLTKEKLRKVMGSKR